MSASTATRSTVPEVFTVDEMIQQTQGRQSWTPGDWRTASHRIPRNDTPWLLLCLSYQRSFPDELLAEAVPDAWSSAEFPAKYLTRNDWRSLWHKAGYTRDGVSADRPTEPTRLWRGACHKGRRGWSWTDDRATADRFGLDMIRGRAAGSVWTTLAPPSALLAYIHGFSRGEHEHVVDTRGLRITEAER